jgi:uncharacterized protein
MINQNLKKYIEESIFPIYSKNDAGHDINHIQYVITRSLKFAKEIPDINLDMVYTVASYHDLGCHIDRKNHEKISSEMLLEDKELTKYFTNEQIITMSEAVCDHRASLEYEPRSVYGKIVSSADRTTSLDDIIQRTYHFTLKKLPGASLEEIIEDSRLHIGGKFGSKGYASNKIYFKDDEYETFLKDVDTLTENKENFTERYLKINNIKL